MDTAKLEKIIKLLKPKFYNKITWLIVSVGASILTKPFWLELLNTILETYNKNYKSVKLSIVGEWDWALALTLIFISLIWNTYNRLLDLKEPVASMPEYKKIKKVMFNSFVELCLAIYPILKDNESVFKSVGPNSGARETEELRRDLTLWYKYRSETIIPNNQKIKEILQENKELLDDRSTSLTRKMINHIDAFEEHIKNPLYDYSQHTFPHDFSLLVEDTCFDYSTHTKKFLKQHKWLQKRLTKIEVSEWYIIGSALLIIDQARDLDILILLKSKEEISKIKDIEFDFNMKFKYKLHSTIFNSNEVDKFKIFLSNNRKNIKGNG